jgi:parallel beta-helix repeat protein
MATIMSDLEARILNRGGGRIYDSTAFPDLGIADDDSTDATPGLQTLVNKIDADRGGVLLVSTEHLISAALSIPDTVATAFAPGGRFKLGPKGSVTFNAPIQAERIFVFDVAEGGAVSFAPGVQDRVFPEWWGAKGNAANDDSFALKAALSAAAGRCLDVARRHRFTQQLNLPSNVHVVSRHRGGFIEGTIDGKPQPRCLSASGASNVVFDGIYLEGLGKTQEGEERGLFFTGCSNVVVRNCEIAEITVGAYFENCTDWRFVDNYVHDIKTRTDNSEGYGVITTATKPAKAKVKVGAVVSADEEVSADVDATAGKGKDEGTNANWVISRNVFRDIERHAVYVSSGSSNGVVEGNVIRTCRSIGIHLYSTDAEPAIQNVTVSGNSITDIASTNGSVSPWGIGGTGNLTGLTIVGNSISNTESGIVFQGNGRKTEANSTEPTRPTGLTIVGNTINHPTTPKPKSENSLGIAVYNVQDVQIASNTVLAPSGTGILATAPAKDPGSRLSGITIAGNRVVSAGNHGITISGGERASHIVLGRNTLRDCGPNPWNIPDNTVGAITYDLPLLTFHFAKAAVPASGTSIMDGPLAGVSSYPAPSGKKCYVVGIAATASGSISDGTCKIKIVTGGTVRDTVELSNSAQTASTSIRPGEFAWLSTERLGAELLTSNFDPSGSVAVTVVLTVMYDPD